MKIMLCTFSCQSLLQMPMTYFIHMGLRLMENNNIVNDLLLSSAHPRDHILQCWSTNDKLWISSTLCQLQRWLVLYMQQWLRRWSTHVWRYVFQPVVDMFSKVLVEKCYSEHHVGYISLSRLKLFLCTLWLFCLTWLPYFRFFLQKG